jgi:hypothetical protein
MERESNRILIVSLGDLGQTTQLWYFGMKAYMLQGV